MVSSSSTLGDEERHILDDVFDAGQTSLREVMVPRTEVDFLAGDLTASQAAQVVGDGAHSRYPVTDGNVDHILGFIHIRDLLDMDPAERHAKVRQIVRPVLSIPDSVKVLKAMSEMRRANSHLAIVLDEYGGTAGIVTLEDIVEEIVGDITDEYDEIEPSDAMHTRLRDIDGLMTLEEFTDRVGLVMPEGPYDTVAGFLMARTGQMPAVGQQVRCHLSPVNQPDDEDEDPNVELTVIELDGRRASWLRLKRLDGAAMEGAVPTVTARPQDPHAPETPHSGDGAPRADEASGPTTGPAQPEDGGPAGGVADDDGVSSRQVGRATLS